MAEPPDSPYCFIVGCSRSGTTLLKRMVNAHPEILIAPESYWIPRPIADRRGLSDGDFVTPDLIPRLYEHRKFRRLRIRRDDLEALIATDAPVSYARFVTGIYELYRKRKGKRLIGEKTPGYVRFIPLLHDLFPWTRFLHIIRDGRDVALSTASWSKRPTGTGASERLWREEPIAACAFRWRKKVRAGIRSGARLGPGLYREVRYEALAGEPEATSRDVTAFLGLPYAPQMLTFHEGRTRTDPGLSPKAAWLPPTSGLREWRTQMSARDVELFEAIAGELLAELGYERAFPRISSGIAARASQCAGWRKS